MVVSACQTLTKKILACISKKATEKQNEQRKKHKEMMLKVKSNNKEGFVKGVYHPDFKSLSNQELVEYLKAFKRLEHKKRKKKETYKKLWLSD
jgi:hypothetical protein